MYTGNLIDNIHTRDDFSVYGIVTVQKGSTADGCVKLDLFVIERFTRASFQTFKIVQGHGATVDDVKLATARRLLRIDIIS